MNLTRKQLEATRLLADPTINFILYGGAIRGAKTYWLILIFLKLALLYPNSRWVIIRKDLPRLKRNLLPPLNEILKDEEFKSHVVDFNKDVMTITLDNESQLILFTENFETDKELDRFRGLEANGIGIDEVNEIEEVTFDKCFERAGSWLNAKRSCYGHLPRPIVLGTCNPTKNWVKTRIYDHWVKGTLPENWRYVQAKITDNPYIPLSYARSLKLSMPAINYQRFVDGDWEVDDKTGLEYIHEFDADRHVKACPFIPGLPTHLTWDFNVSPYLTLLCYQIVQRSEGGYQVQQFDEICLEHPRNSAAAVGAEYLARYWTPYRANQKSNAFLYGDAQGNNRVEGKGDEKRFDWVKDALRPCLHNNSDRTMRNNPSVIRQRDFFNNLLSGQKYPLDWVVDPRCKNTILDYQKLKQGPVGFLIEKGSNASGGSFEKYGHCYTASSYFAIGAFASWFDTDMQS